MDNQHRQIKGYRELSQVEIDLMNEIKAKGAELQALMQKVAQHHRDYVEKTLALDVDTTEEEAAFNAAEPGRWLSIARTTLQTGIMQLTRAVARPTSF